jgi:hypothetical protein
MRRKLPTKSVEVIVNAYRTALAGHGKLASAKDASGWAQPQSWRMRDTLQQCSERLIANRQG